MDRTFLNDPTLVDARAALAVTGLPLFDVKVVDHLPGQQPPKDTVAMYDGKIDALWIKEAAGDEHVCASVHEFAHAIWHRAATEIDLRPKINAVLKASSASDRIAEFEEDHVLEPTAQDAYVLNANEVWARAAAQYVFTLEDQPQRIRDMWTHVMASHHGGLVCMQWEADDFAPIAEVFEHEFPKR